MSPGFDLQPYHVWILSVQFVTGKCFIAVFRFSTVSFSPQALWIYSCITELNRSQWSHGQRNWFAVAPYWDSGFESRRGRGCLPVVIVVCCQKSLRRADHSSRGVLPSVVYLSVIVKH